MHATCWRWPHIDSQEVSAVSMFHLLVGFFLSIGVYFAAQPFLKNRKRRQLLQQDFPQDWLEILQKNVPVYNKMPESLQQQLRQKMQVFIFEKNFRPGNKYIEIVFQPVSLIHYRAVVFFKIGNSSQQLMKASRD